MPTSTQKPTFRFYLIIILIILFAIFTVQNAAVVTITFLFWSFTVSRALMIVFIFVIGMLTGWLAARYHRYKHR